MPAADADDEPLVAAAVPVAQLPRPLVIPLGQAARNGLTS